MEQRVLDNLRALRIAQITSPVTLIQISLDQDVLLPLGFTFGQDAQILFPFLYYFHWQRICQSESNVLGFSFRVVMRDIPARKPSRPPQSERLYFCQRDVSLLFRRARVFAGRRVRSYTIVTH